jgi:N-acetylneuraminic acid mutarotase
LKKKVYALTLILALFLSIVGSMLVELATANPLAFLPAITIKSDGTADSWVTRAPMPSGSWGGLAAVVEGKIYVVGGFSPVNYVYDPSTDNWTARTPPPGIHFDSVVAYQNKIYCIGGTNTEVYDTSTDSWIAKTPMPISIYGFANIVDGQIYVISGYDYPNATQLTGINQLYSIATDSWTTKASIPQPVSAYASTVCDGKIYIMGGQDPSLGANAMNVDFTQIYDPSNDSWSVGAPMPTKVRGATACATTGIMAPENVYLFGGLGSSSGRSWVYSLTQVYSPKNNSWSYGAPMLSPRVLCAVVNVNDALFMLGGSETGLGPYNLNNEEYLPLGYSPTVQATTENGSTARLTVSGNITTAQMSNVTIITDQSAMTANVTFTLSGESGTVGFGNITIPTNAVPNGTVPTVYIDGQLAQDQGYTQDNDDFYVWFTAHFSSHQISIVFAQNQTPVDFGWVQVAILGLIGAVAILVVILAVVFLSKRGKRVNLKV